MSDEGSGIRSFSALFQQLGDDCGPAGLVAGAEALARVAVEVLVEQDVIAEVRIALEALVPAVERPPPALVADPRPRRRRPARAPRARPRPAPPGPGPPRRAPAPRPRPPPPPPPPAPTVVSAHTPAPYVQRWIRRSRMCMKC